MSAAPRTGISRRDQVPVLSDGDSAVRTADHVVRSAVQQNGEPIRSDLCYIHGDFTSIKETMPSAFRRLYLQLVTLPVERDRQAHRLISMPRCEQFSSKG